MATLLRHRTGTGLTLADLLLPSGSDVARLVAGVRRLMSRLGR